MKTRLSAVVLALLLLPSAAHAWSGDTWASISREAIKSNADFMIDCKWTPKNTFTHWAYSSTYITYTAGNQYTGVAYTQNNPQENLGEFLSAVTNTAGGNLGSGGYGNDCSGFVSICWKLTARQVTSTFESGLGGKWFSLGDIGTAATAPLVTCDALNSDSVGHIVLFLQYDTGGVRTMEQTPNNAQRKLRSFSNVAEYRPIRRMQILENRCIMVSGNLAFGNVAVGTSGQATLTIKSTGTNTLTVTGLSLPTGFSGNWSGTIAAGGSQNVPITFSPTAYTTYGGTLSVASDATVGTNTLSLSGTGSTLLPQIVTQPQSQTVLQGQSTTLSVTATGAALSYQWRFNGVNLSTVTQSSYTIPSPQFYQSGNYDVVVANPYATLTSQVALLEVGLPAVTQTLWLDNFDADTAANWVLNRSSSDCRATFNYDYSANGIPTAPNSTNGTTRGLKLEANVSQGVVAALNLSPSGQSFGGNYRLRFDLWINQNGPFPGGGTGSTQHGTAGVGTAGNTVQWTGTGSTADGCWFAVDGDGQASDTSTTTLNDFCAFSGTTFYAAGSGVYAAGTGSDSRGNLNAYYAATFPSGRTAPAAQQTAYPQQTGGLAVGTIGFAWRDVIINKSGSTVDWSINGLKIATLTGANLTASNIFVGLWDSFASLSDNTNLSFAIFDNVRVERLLTNVPPYVTRKVQAQTVKQGDNVTFSVSAGGTAPLAYQWRLNSQNLAGATDSSYSCNSIQATNAGMYSVFITNAVGNVASSALLTVLPPPQPGHFESLRQLNDGTVQLTMTGSSGTNYLLQWSSDLVTWSNACTLCATNGGFSWLDTPATNGQRFYRLLLAP